MILRLNLQPVGNRIALVNRLGTVGSGWVMMAVVPLVSFPSAPTAPRPSVPHGWHLACRICFASLSTLCVLELVSRIYIFDVLILIAPCTPLPEAATAAAIASQSLGRPHTRPVHAPSTRAALSGARESERERDPCVRRRHMAARDRS